MKKSNGGEYSTFYRCDLSLCSCPLMVGTAQHPACLSTVSPAIDLCRKYSTNTDLLIMLLSDMVLFLFFMK